jgi:hypothetical protein
LASTAWWSPSLQRRPGHRAPGELVDDEHLPVGDDVVHVLLVQRVGAQQLVHHVQRLAAARVLHLDARRASIFSCGSSSWSCSMRCTSSEMSGQHELVVAVGRERVDAAVGQVDRVPALVEHVQQVLLELAVLLLGRRELAVGDVVQLHLLDHLLHARLLHDLHQALVLRRPEPGLVQQSAAAPCPSARAPARPRPTSR